jgi:UDP-2-acetamido-3-amino-2,3-dideoxy-glucuronate N-acetyltransferase
VRPEIGTGAFVHPTALVEDDARIGEGAKIWHHAQIRAGARIGARSIVGKGAFVDAGVTIGPDCKLQNYACIYHGVSLGRGVFVGPHVVFTNDRLPRATAPDFSLLRDGEWEVGLTTVADGASFGANCTILPGLRIGAWALIGAGAVVTADVAPYTLVAGTPARPLGWVCRCGTRLAALGAACPRCGLATQ